MLYMLLLCLALALVCLAFWTAGFETRTHKSLHELAQHRRDLAGELVALSTRVSAVEGQMRVRRDVVRLDVKAILDEVLRDQNREIADLKNGLADLYAQVETLAVDHHEDVKFLRRDLDAALDRTGSA